MLWKSLNSVHTNNSDTNIIMESVDSVKPRLHVLIRITLNRIGMQVSAVHTRNPKLD